MSILLENREFRLALGEDARTQSLILKSTGEECLDTSNPVSFFSVTQDRPFNNELKLAFCNKRTTYEANSLRREGDFLIVGFEKILYEAEVALNITDSYISFRLAGFRVPPEAFGGLRMDTPSVAKFRLACLNIKERKNFGRWLNVMWDEKVAVNLLATSPHALIDSHWAGQTRNLTADAVRELKLRDCEAALIVTAPENLLDRIGALEEDYNLPHGAKARTSEYINASSYWVQDLSPDNVDQHIALCKQAGLGLMLIYYKAFFQEEVRPDGNGGGYSYCGDYDLRPCYGDLEQLKAMLRKITDAGILPGIHILHTHIGFKSRYVTPIADRRLNKKLRLTLSRDIGETDDVIYVDESPALAPIHPDCRVLQIDGELIYYDHFTTEYPYRFEGCVRGHWDTQVTPHKQGAVGGVADISEFGGKSIHVNQYSDLQEEIGRKLAAVYNCGCRFVYYDGSEGVNPPYEYHVPNAQYRVYRLLEQEPLFCEGAAKAHFNWHMLSGGNAFDLDSRILVPTEDQLKPMLAKYPLRQAPHTAKDFTRISFGWWKYLPDTQPDTFEYGTSHAAACDCPVIMKAHLENMAANLRNADVLESMRRWETARKEKLLTAHEKEALKNPDREFHLLRRANGTLELTEYREVDTVENLRAFVFEKDGASCAVIWHRTGRGNCRLPLSCDDISYLDEFEGTPLPIEASGNGIILNVENRAYLHSTLSLQQLTAALEQAHWL